MKIVEDYVPLSQAKVTMGMDAAARSFRNLTLSYRGSERQPPNTLQLALRFSVVMEERANNGEHHSGMSTEDRLRDVIYSFHMSPGLQAKHRLDDEKIKSVYNIVAGTCSVPQLILHIFACSRCGLHALVGF